MLEQFIKNRIIAELPFEANEGQLELLDKLSQFIVSPTPRKAFILRGYAGTGKTSIMAALVGALQHLQQRIVLLAPTGRAAKVLSGYAHVPAYTIHKYIYRARSKSAPNLEDATLPFKGERQPLRLWGKVEDGVIKKAASPVITTQCIRVPVLNGHTAAVFVKFDKKPTKEQLIEKLVSFKGLPQELELPSAPKQFIQYLEEDNRPQVNLDVDFENGMGISIGRLREDSVYDYKFVGLSHNTVRGAAGGAVLSAELLKALGYIEPKNA